MLWINQALLKVTFRFDCLADFGANKTKNEKSNEPCTQNDDGWLIWNSTGKALPSLWRNLGT